MSFFREFSDVESREEIPQIVSDLEKVLDIETEMIKQYKNSNIFELYHSENPQAYKLIHSETEERLRDINLDSNLLQQYIDARENKEMDIVAIIRGMYSAALLEIITTKKPHTQTIIDGNNRNRTWNFLFSHVKHAKNVAVKNIKGNYILSFAGSYGGNVEGISCENIRGSYTLSHAGSDSGKIEYLLLSNIKGHKTLEGASMHKGNLQKTVLHNIKGDFTFSGSRMLSGNIQDITLHDIEGDYTLTAMGDEYKIKNVVLTKIKGDDTFSSIDCACKVNCTAFNHIIGEGTLKDTGFSFNRSILLEHQLNEPQKKIILEIEKIAESMHTLSLAEQKIAHDEIAELQTEIFSEVKK